MSNMQEKLKRVRPPRVQITYDVETEGATVKKELPFTVGVMGDFSAQSTKQQPAYGDRKFIEIDRDNFNDVMSGLSPALQLKVDNTLTEDDTKLGVDLNFNKMEDFEPQNIVSQVPALKQLLDSRNALRDILSKADRSEELENLLEEVLKNADSLASLSNELGIKADQPTADTKES